MLPEFGGVTEEASKRQAKQDEWLKTFCHNLEKSQNHHDKIIQGLESRVTTLAKETIIKADKNEDCKAIFTNDGTPLYTPFYYSHEEIEYFSANSGFSDEDESKNVTLISDEDLKQPSPRQTKTHYIELYVPPIPFPRRLEQHAEEALIHKTIESLKKIKTNRPFLKEIRQSDEYPKYMKDLVTNKPVTIENEDVRMNRRCSALLFNQLPPKEKDHGSFYPTLLDWKEDLITAHAKVDVFKRSISLEVGNEKVIFKLKSDLPDMKNELVLMIQSNIITEEEELMNIESDLFTYNTNTCESCHILAVDTDLFTYEIVTQETYEEIAHKCCLTTQNAIGEKTKPVLGKRKSHWCALIYRQNNGIQEVWASCNPSNEECDGGSLRNNEIRCYWESENDNNRVNIEWNDLRMPYIAPLPIITEQVKITRYSLGPGEVYTKLEVSNMEELPRTRKNITTLRSDIMDEVFESHDDEMT
ncbi:hypothetical protein Tco_1215016 [Tanacetum coccineum]